MSDNKVGIAAVFKNEYQFIVEWLAYHRVLGISEFFIADNESDDGTTDLLKALQALGYLKYVTYKTEPGVKPQLAAYQLLINNFGSSVDWLCFIDADEFLKPKNKGFSLEKSLSPLLSRNDVGGIAVHWALYGSSHWITAESAPVIERFTKRAAQNRGINQHYKSIVRTAACKSTAPNPHVFTLENGYIYVDTTGRELSKEEHEGLTQKNVSWDPLRLNHYVVKSRSEFFTKKRPRGRPNGLFRSAEFFVQHDLNEEDDNFDTEFLNDVARESELIRKRLRDEVKFQENVLEYEKTPFFSSGADKLNACIDIVKIQAGKIECRGWVTGTDAEFTDFKILLDYNKIIRAARVERMRRNDVTIAYKLDPTQRYGFACVFDFDASEIKISDNSIVELCVAIGRQNIGMILPIPLKKLDLQKAKEAV